MRSVVLTVLAASVLIGPAGCVFKREPKDSAAKRLLGFDDARGRLRETSLEDLEKEQARPRGGLSLTISTNKATYEPGERIFLEVKLTNVTGGRSGMKARDIPVYFEVFAKGPQGNQQFWLIKPLLRSDKTGRVHFRSPDFNVPADKRGDYYHFVTLPPGAFVGRSFGFPGRLLGLTPGEEYSFTVAYAVDEEFPHVILNRHFTPQQVELLGIKLAYVRIWTGRLSSNRAYFRIKRKRRFLGLF
jgi:hypothetical protein